MENRAEDEIVARWRAEEKAKEEEEEERGREGEGRFDLVMNGGDGSDARAKRRRLEAAVGGRLDTLAEFVGRGGGEVVEMGAGGNARRGPVTRKRQGKERVRRVVDLEAEYTG